MKRSELQAGAEYALNTWSGNSVSLGDAYGLARVVVLSTAQVEREPTSYSRRRASKVNDGVRVKILGEQTSEGFKDKESPVETVVATRKIIGTWEQHEQAVVARARAAVERERREREAARRTQQAVSRIEELVPEGQRRLVPWGIKESGRSYGNLAATELAALMEVAYERGRQDERDAAEQARIQDIADEGRNSL